MKNSLFILPLFLFGLTSFSQEDEKPKRVNELYLSPSFSPLTINFSYKRQISDKNTFFKLGFIGLNTGYEKKTTNETNEFPEHKFSLSGGVIFGIEFRKELNKKLNLYNGPNLHYYQSYSETSVLTPTLVNNKLYSGTFSTGASYTFGLLYQLSKSFLLSVDLSPSLIYSNIKTKNNIYNDNEVVVERIFFRLNNGTFFSLVYRF